MQKLSDLLREFPKYELLGAADREVRAVISDSRQVEPGDCFVAVEGTRSDGHQYIAVCIARGASTIVCERLPDIIQQNVTYVQVSSSAEALGLLASAFYHYPSRKMKVVGVTGTNGKTSIATLLFRLHRAMGYKCGLLSTVQNQIDDNIIASTHTTPDAVSLNALMDRMVDEGCSHCFMEVSSHAVDQRRIAGIHFTGGVFSNITHDHLDYHKTFENYLRAKKRFFDNLPSSPFALTNADDRNGMIMLQNTRAGKHTYALKSAADFKTKISDNHIGGLQLEIDGTEVYTRLIGTFNAYNLTAVYATAILLGGDKEKCLTILSALSPPEGRFEQVFSPREKIAGIVDYAHTPDALKNVLQTINAVRTGNEHVITVVGCGGDRDAAKRPVMAEIAAHFSNKVVLTSDNPRSEDPEAIIDAMYSGVPATEKRKVLKITDRKEAIRTAVMLSGRGDIILLAGKGHEKYQEIKGVKTHFDDKEELLCQFAELSK